jgi:RNA polymerase sigma-70 factor (ECF subfamily)
MMDVVALPATKASAGADARLRAAVDAHYDVVWRFLRRMGVREEAVEDAAQQVLLVFARRMEGVDPGAELSFLLGTALRVAADFRKQVARTREVADGQTLERWVASTRDPGEEIDERRARQWLDAILGRMPDDLRAIFVMCDLEELTMADAATLLAIPPGTAASRLRRARATFHELVEDARRRAALRAGRSR